MRASPPRVDYKSSNEDLRAGRLRPARVSPQDTNHARPHHPKRHLEILLPPSVYLEGVAPVPSVVVAMKGTPYAGRNLIKLQIRPQMNIFPARLENRRLSDLSPPSTCKTRVEGALHRECLSLLPHTVNLEVTFPLCPLQSTGNTHQGFEREEDNLTPGMVASRCFPGRYQMEIYILHPQYTYSCNQHP